MNPIEEEHMKRRDSRTPAAGVAVLALALLGAGCSESIAGLPSVDEGDLKPGHTILGEGAGITLTAQAPTFTPGQPVTLTLANSTNADVGHNLCFWGMEKRTENAWVLQEIPRICTTVLYQLGTGATTTYQAILPTEVTPGEYRFRVAIYLASEEAFRDQVSQPFEVED